MVNYSLGKLSPEAEQQLEKLYFANDQLFDRLQAVKEQLIDDYLHGGLQAEDILLFEQHFLSSPPLREQVEFARYLMLPSPTNTDAFTSVLSSSKIFFDFCNALADFVNRCSVKVRDLLA